MCGLKFFFIVLRFMRLIVEVKEIVGLLLGILGYCSNFFFVVIRCEDYVI